MPRGGVRRGHGPAAGADQGRPGRPGAVPADATPRSAVPHVVTSRDPGDRAVAGAGRRCSERLVGQVSVFIGHSGVGKSTLVNALVPGRRPGHRGGQRRHRPGAAHLLLGHLAAAARRRGMGRRHPRRALVRAGARAAGADRLPLPRPGAGHRRAARAGAPTTSPTARSTRGWSPDVPGRPGRSGWSPCAGCCAPAPPSPRTDSPGKPAGSARFRRPNLPGLPGSDGQTCRVCPVQTAKPAGSARFRRPNLPGAAPGPEATKPAGFVGDG